MTVFRQSAETVEHFFDWQVRHAREGDTLVVRDPKDVETATKLVTDRGLENVVIVTQADYDAQIVTISVTNNQLVALHDWVFYSGSTRDPLFDSYAKAAREELQKILRNVSG